MTETHRHRAAAPVFPPGRYGRRRDRRSAVAGADRSSLAVVVVLPAVLIAVQAVPASTATRDYQRRGRPAARDVTDSQVTVDVRRSACRPAAPRACLVRARDRDGAEVGRAEVTGAPPAAAHGAHGW